MRRLAITASLALLAVLATRAFLSLAVECMEHIGEDDTIEED